MSGTLLLWIQSDKQRFTHPLAMEMCACRGCQYVIKTANIVFASIWELFSNQSSPALALSVLLVLGITFCRLKDLLLPGRFPIKCGGCGSMGDADCTCPHPTHP